MNANDFSRREFLKLGGMSIFGAAMTVNFGTKAFATPTGTPFDPVRFAVITDAHIDIKGKNAMKMSAISSECVKKNGCRPERGKRAGLCHGNRRFTSGWRSGKRSGDKKVSGSTNCTLLCPVRQS